MNKDSKSSQEIIQKGYEKGLNNKEMYNCGYYQAPMEGKLEYYTNIASKTAQVLYPAQWSYYIIGLRNGLEAAYQKGNEDYKNDIPNYKESSDREYDFNEGSSYMPAYGERYSFSDDPANFWKDYIQGEGFIHPLEQGMPGYYPNDTFSQTAETFKKPYEQTRRNEQTVERRGEKINQACEEIGVKMRDIRKLFIEASKKAYKDHIKRKMKKIDERRKIIGSRGNNTEEIYVPSDYTIRRMRQIDKERVEKPVEQHYSVRLKNDRPYQELLSKREEEEKETNHMLVKVIGIGIVTIAVITGTCMAIREANEKYGSPFAGDSNKQEEKRINEKKVNSEEVKIGDTIYQVVEPDR